MLTATGKSRISVVKILLLLSLACNTAVSHAAKLASIIIDDLGNNYDHGRTVIDFPAPLTIAILPRTDFAKELAALAHKQDKEVMLHLPLQSVENHKHSPGTLDLHMSRHEFVRELRSNLDSVPHISGINNHMGSLLTQHPGHMSWLMEEIAQLNDMYFIDSRTSKNSVASTIATEHRVPNMNRDVFLDPDFRPQTIRRQFNRFISIANRKGHAIAIAHPHPVTLAFIRNHLNELEDQGIELVPVSRLIALEEKNDNVTCTGTTCSGM